MDMKSIGGGGAEGEAKPAAGAMAADSYADYVPAKLSYGPAHVEHVVESASLACANLVPPPRNSSSSLSCTTKEKHDSSQCAPRDDCAGAAASGLEPASGTTTPE